MILRVTLEYGGAVDAHSTPEANSFSKHRSVRSSFHRSMLRCYAARQIPSSKLPGRDDRGTPSIEDHGRVDYGLAAGRNVRRGRVQKDLGNSFWSCCAEGHHTWL